MVGLSPNQFERVHKNYIPIVEELLTLNVLLYDIDIVDGNIIGEFAERSVQKYDNTVSLLRYNYHICYVSNINAVFQSFRCPNCDIFSTEHPTWSTFNYLQWTSKYYLSEERISNPKNCLWQAELFRYQIHKSTKTVQKLSKIGFWINLCPRRVLQRYKDNNVVGNPVPISVSISSNVVEEPNFLYNSDPHHLVSSFIGALEGLASQLKHKWNFSPWYRDNNKE